MSFLRNVLHDLVEKRLWPIALLLVVALVAIPVVLSGSSEESASAPSDLAVAPTAKAAGSAQVVSDDTVVQEPVTRSGKTRNPFKQQHVPAADSAQDIITTTPTTVGGDSGSSTSSDSGSSDTGSSDQGSTPSDTTTPADKPKPKPKTDPQDLYRVDLRFGEVGDLRARNNVARLTPLPSSTNPFLVFLGVKADGKTAVFLVSAEAVPSGDGKCRPSAKSCESLELKEGDTELVDLQTGTAGVVQYRLDLRKIEKVTASSAAKAARARARESKAGRDYLRMTLAADPSALNSWGYSTKLGVLVERTPELREGDVAHVPTGIAQTATG